MSVELKDRTRYENGMKLNKEDCVRMIYCDKRFGEWCGRCPHVEDAYKKTVKFMGAEPPPENVREAKQFICRTYISQMLELANQHPAVKERN